MRTPIFTTVLFSLFFVRPLVVAQDGFVEGIRTLPPPALANYDEAKVPKFELTDPLKTLDGRKVDTPELWNTVRRPELLKLFEEHMFGRPTRFQRNGEEIIRMQWFHRDTALALDGKALRHQFQLVFYSDASIDADTLVALATNNIDNDGTFPRLHVADLLVFTPKSDHSAKRVPILLRMNAAGNHSVSTDPGIRLATGQQESARGSGASRGGIELAIERGYAIATALNHDFEPDYNGGFREGVRRFLYAENEEPEPDEANTIATWAWGHGKILDAILANQDLLNIDPDKVAVMGHSRLGKTALWAGAIDTRFALVISNNSGCGGAALARREYGETVHQTNTIFPHWFCGNYKKYNLDVNALPFDQHELIALIAPRPVYIASAVEDHWADPKGEFLSGFHADPVYRLLGTDGIAGAKEMPPLNQPVGGRIGYHIREGEHDIKPFDWDKFLDFADKHWR